MREEESKKFKKKGGLLREGDAKGKKKRAEEMQVGDWK